MKNKILYVSFLFVNLLFCLFSAGQVASEKEDPIITKYLLKAEYYEKTDSVEKLYSCLNTISTQYLYDGQLSKSLEYCRKAEKFGLEHKIKNMATTYFNFGSDYMNLGNYDSAIICYSRSLEIARKFNNKNQEADALNNIGYLNRVWGHYEQALEAFRATLEIDRHFGDSALVASDLNNVAYAYAYMKKNNEAIKYYNQSLNISQKYNYKYESGLAYSGLASIFRDEENFSNAEKLSKNAIRNFIESNHRDELAGIYSMLGFILNNENKSDSAIYYMTLGYKLACEYKNAEFTLYSLKQLSTFWSAKGEFSKAYDYQKLYSLKKDSIFTIEKYKKMADFQSRYQLDEKDAEITKIASEKKRILKRQYAIASGSVLGIAFLTFFLFRLLRKYKENKKLVTFLSQQKMEVEQTLERMKASDAKRPNYPTWNLPDNELEEIFIQITNFLTDSKLFLDVNLTLPVLAQKCGLQAHHISKAVNSKSDGNFNDFINSFRIAEARKRLFHKDFKLFTIEAIGRSVGFKSRTSFIAAFRKIENLTPSDYKKSVETPSHSKTA